MARAALGLACTASLVLAAACAIMEAPQGGPEDRTPPALVSVLPDSGSVGLAGSRVLRFRFSEKMDRQNAVSWLRLYPEQELRGTKWHGALEAEVTLLDPLPADTVVVVELLPGMADSHRVRSTRARRYPLATGDSLPAGQVSGRLVMGDTVLAGAVVELYDLPADTVKYFQQKILRRTQTDDAGIFRFQWLQVPGGPWLVRAFADTDGNLRPGDREARRLLPDTLRITPDEPAATTGDVRLYPWNEPGVLTAGPFPVPPWPGGVGAWAQAVGEADTGWVAGPAPAGSLALGWLDPELGGRIEKAAPGRNRVLVFADLDGDSTFSAVPDSLFGLPAAADSTAWFLEPWGLAEEVILEPGLSAEFSVPALGDSLVPWAAPAPALPDSLALPAPGDSAAAPDSIPAPGGPADQE